ncbi:MAG: hypothetical protein H6682_20915 [Candidatus Eisenbacteria bacterium]|nr:hypothetical protein [Candidatus Eisenbacteria bacterium]
MKQCHSTIRTTLTRRPRGSFRPCSTLGSIWVIAGIVAGLLAALAAAPGPCAAESRLVPPVERRLDELRQAGLPGDDPYYTSLPALPIAGLDDTSWIDAFGPPTLENSVLAAVVWADTSLVVGGDFLEANEAPALHVARWADTKWEPLGDGLDESVYTLVEWNGQLIAGGLFRSSGDGSTELNHVAAWNGSSWQAMGDGFDDPVLALTVVENTLYAGGWFIESGSTVVNHIARWDAGAETWQPLGTGLTGGASPHVTALGEVDGQLLVGGRFTSSANGSVRNLATWANDTWTEFGGGAGDRIYAFGTVGDALYAAGLFTEIGGVSAQYVAKWNDTAWEPLDSGTNEPVLCLTGDADTLYVGGHFTLAGDTTAISVAKYDGTAWSSVKSGMNGSVTQLLPWSDYLVAGGIFTQAGGGDVSFVAALDDNGWGPIGAALDGSVNALQVYGDKLVVGGTFSRAGRDAKSIAAWDGRSWTPFGDGLEGTVRSLCVHESSLYAGGDFALTDSTDSHLARWDSSAETWVDFGAASDDVRDMISWDGSLYIGGDFQTVGGLSVGRVAEFDGEAWYALGNGLNGPVYALSNYHGELVAGGEFTRSLLDTLNYVGHFDGTSWRAFDNGMTGPVREISRFTGDGAHGDLIVGGDFAAEADGDPEYLAAWDDSVWAAVSSSIVGPSIDALLSTGPSLYVGGEFAVPTSEGSATRIARSDGSFAWSRLGSGVNGKVRALALYDDLLYVAGDFSAAGGKSSPFLARWGDVGPVPVLLSHLDARREGPDVVLQWTVSDAIDHLGFRIYRGDTSEDGLVTDEFLHSEDGSYEFVDGSAPTYELLYWIEEVSLDGHSLWFGPLSVIATSGPGSGDGSTPSIRALGPLPFRDRTSFRLAASGSDEVAVDVYDVRGRHIRTLWRGVLPSGEVDVTWDGRTEAGRTVGASLYFVRATAPGWGRTLRVLRLE